jgi:hypothetical protein
MGALKCMCFWASLCLGLLVGCDGEEGSFSNLYGPCGDQGQECQAGLTCVPDPSAIAETFYCTVECSYAESYGGDEVQQMIGECQTQVSVCGQGCCRVNSYELASEAETERYPLDSDSDFQCPEGEKPIYGKCVPIDPKGDYVLSGFCAPFVQ